MSKDGCRKIAAMHVTLNAGINSILTAGSNITTIIVLYCIETEQERIKFHPILERGMGAATCNVVLRPIYTVQLCRMRYAYDKSTTRIVSCKSNLQLACDCRVRHEECRGLLKHALKTYDNRSDRQFYIVEIVYDFSMTRAARAIKIACDNREQKSYPVNRPLLSFST